MWNRVKYILPGHLGGVNLGTGFRERGRPCPSFLRLHNASARLWMRPRGSTRGFSAAPPDFEKRPADADGFRETPTAALSKMGAWPEGARGRPFRRSAGRRRVAP